jgi:hypothetical protein
MKKQDALFQLIKSLTRGEKRNFRMLAQLTAGDKKYVQLFDALESQEEYDEVKILKKFRKDDKFEKQFAYNKNYLYNSILNSLVYFHKGQDAELSSLTLQVRILVEKNLFFQAKKLLSKAKETVLVQEKFEDLLKLLHIEAKLLRRTENLKVLPDALRQVEFEERIALDKIQNYLGYRRLESQMYILNNTQHVARKDDDLGLVRHLLQNELLQEERNALSNRARIMYNEIKRRIALFQDDHHAAFEYSERALALYDEVHAIREDEKIAFLQQITNSAHHRFFVEGPLAALASIVRLRDVKVNTPQERIMRFEKYYAYHLALLNSMGDAATEAFLTEYVDELNALENEFGEGLRIPAMWILASHYLMHGQYSNALAWANRFLNHPRTNTRSDIQAGMRLMNLVIHYELGNYDLIEYHLKSAYRFIYKQERMHLYERRVLRFFKEFLDLPSKDGLVALMSKFREDIVEISKDPFEERGSNIFNFLAWLDSKLDNVPMPVAKRAEMEAFVASSNKAQTRTSEQH